VDVLLLNPLVKVHSSSSIPVPQSINMSLLLDMICLSNNEIDGGKGELKDGTSGKLDGPNTYVWWEGQDETQEWYIDALFKGNEARLVLPSVPTFVTMLLHRYINAFQGIGLGPNVRVLPVWDRRTQSQRLMVQVWYVIV
jgi:hypothetical protein